MDPLKAFFSDETAVFRDPVFVKPNDMITIRLRAPLGLRIAPVLLNEYSEITMDLESENSRFSYYVCKMRVPEHNTHYGFKVVFDDRVYYYTRTGVKDFYDWGDCFDILPGFSIPDWAWGSIMYQIFPDRFCNGGKMNDVVNAEYYYAGRSVEHVYDWNAPVANLDVARFYGGDIPGIMKKLDYLQDLGVETIYLNPIFVSPSNHKYDCQDYDHIDPHLTVIAKDVGAPGVFGNNRYVIRTTLPENLEASDAYFASFCEEVHRRGMHIILDGVFNHCGSFNKWMDREGYYSANTAEESGAYNSPDSKYRDFFRFANPSDPNSYEGWWGFDTLPKLNYEGSEELCEYICRIGAKWVSAPYNVDGWRLDVAADLGHSSEFNHKFWKRFRKAVKEANPNAIILAEHYGDPTSWLMGDEWDSIMNYDAFMEPITWFLTGMDKHSDEYKDFMLNNTDALMGGLFSSMRRFSIGSLYSAMNELSNHDHSRFLTRTNHYVGRVAQLGADAASRDIHPEVFAEAVVFQMTWPGCPTIYYGDEAGLCGFTDPDNRRTYPWGRENKTLLTLHKELCIIRKHNPFLRTGSLMPLVQEYGLFGFARFDRSNVIVTLINNNDSDKDVHVSLEEIDIDVPAMVPLISTHMYGISFEATIYHVVDHSFDIRMTAHSSVILKSFMRGK
jgi:alpha-glucosidase